MKEEYFVSESSVVRQIWGKSDTILFIFAGGAAEFALNKAVDWLYFTGRLPADPLNRLFSTVSYAQAIVFSKTEAAEKAIDSMRDIHAHVEATRGYKIPDWAYRDVLFMLIDYSIRSFELLERPLTLDEKKEVFTVFNAVGDRMGIQGLPRTYAEWLGMRVEHLEADLLRSNYTDDLFSQYRKHLGPVRYRLLIEGQVLVAPPVVRKLLGFRKWSLLSPVVALYKWGRVIHLDSFLKRLILPPEFKTEIRALDHVST